MKPIVALQRTLSKTWAIKNNMKNMKDVDKDSK